MDRSGYHLLRNNRTRIRKIHDLYLSRDRCTQLTLSSIRVAQERSRNVGRENLARALVHAKLAWLVFLRFVGQY